MGLFTEMENTQAYLKCGLLGFAGSGKSTTATNIATGLITLLREKGLADGNKPAFFLDTESGADWVKPLFEKENIKLFVSKTRAFKDLVTAVSEAEKEASVLIVDSLTHFWTELTTSYAKKKNRTYGLQFQDWAVLKEEWRKFTDLYVNSNLHIILAGRAGYEYDFFENEDGKKELEKTGVKMKAENETGYEASLLVYMECHQEMGDNGKLAGQYRTATVLKDRSRLIDGKLFKNPTFANFLPHVSFLNLGGQQIGVDVSRNSQELFSIEGKPQWEIDKQAKTIALEEIKDIIVKYHPGQAAADKKAKGDLLEKHLGTRTWERIETLKRFEIEDGRNKLWQELEGRPYEFVKPVDELLDELPNFDNPIVQEAMRNAQSAA